MRVVVGVGNREFVYDAFGNLVQVKENGSPIYSCDYDAFGRRFRETVGGVTRYFLYDGGVPYAEIGPTGTLIRKFYWGLTGPICQRMPSGTNRWYIADAHGNTRALVYDNGALTDWYTYDAWGNLVGSHSNVVNDNPFRWNGSVGYRYIAPTGLYHAGAREYDPTVGRWLQRDPIGMSGGHPNLYAYVGNDPVESNDPTGLVKPWALGSGGATGVRDSSSLLDYVEPVAKGLIDFLIGLGDGCSFGGSKWVRENLLGYEDLGEFTDSGWYTGGTWAGYGLNAAIADGLQTGARVVGVGARIEKFRRAGGGLGVYVGRGRVFGLDLHPIPVVGRTVWLPHLHLWPRADLHIPWSLIDKLMH